MSADVTTIAAPFRRQRVDAAPARPPVSGSAFWMMLLALAAGFVLLGGGSLDLGTADARLGLAASEATGPLGQVFGGWAPDLWPGQVLPSQLWAWLEGAWPSVGAVRWPAAIAGIVIGLMLAGRLGSLLGARAGVLLGFAWFGSVALIDRSAGAGVELIGALGVIGALDRILARGSDAVAGLWMALAFLCGGWPPVALILLAAIVIGRRGSTLSWRLVVPPAVAFAGWSAWMLGGSLALHWGVKHPPLPIISAEAWAAALALPLTQRPDWLLALEALALGLPWSPFVALVASPSVRAGWQPAGRAWVVGWIQAAGACLVAGTLIPGVAAAARMPALAGLVIGAAAVCDRLWANMPELPRRVRCTGIWIALATVLVWTVPATSRGIFLALVVPYYRGIAIIVVGLTIVTAALALAAAWREQAARSVALVAAVAVCLKLAHWGVYVPEWNYRWSQGPWGRAIGQWVPPYWPIFTMHAWPADLAFATEHPVRQLVNPRLLNYMPRERPIFVLLQAAEFEHWPADAPRLLEVHRFEDEHGQTRVLARTEGDLARYRLSLDPE